MYRTYEQPNKNQIFISSFDGDCMYYTIFDTVEEMEIEQARLKKIDEEYKREKEAYLKSLECGE